MEIHSIPPGARREEPKALLLDADPSWEMIERYLQQGIFLLAEEENRPVGVLCGVPLAQGGWEVKNLAVAPHRQKQGVGKALLAAFEGQLPPGAQVQVGTSETGIPYYQGRGYTYSHRVEGFFTRHYPPLWEEGVLLTDMYYLVKTLPLPQGASPCGTTET